MKNPKELCSPRRALAAPHHILVALDADDADYLVAHAIAQAETTGAQVTLLHAIIPMNSLAVEAGAIPYLNEAAVEQDATNMLRGIAYRFQTHGIQCDTAVRRGYAADVICDEIRRIGATRLIMGTHGRKHLAQLALGSVAKEVLRHATIPVFAVGPHAHKMAGRETPKKILHPVSLVGQYAESVDFAIEVAQIHGAQLHLLHVLASDLEANSDPGQSLDWAEDAMSALVPAEPHSIPPVETSATFGDVIREILFAAAVADADWIVMGVHCNCPFWPLNSNTAYRVLAEANCPVLTIPHDPYRTLNLAENLKGIEIPGSTPQEKSQEGRAPLAARVELRPIN